MLLGTSRLRQLRPMKIDRHAFNRHGRLLLYAAGFAVIGLIVLFITHAAQSGVSAEVESGALSGTAAQLSDTVASGGKAVRFGSTPGTVAAPTSLHGFTGGDSIALRWGAIDAQYGPAKYHVYRDKMEIVVLDAATAPKWRYEEPATGYIDKSVTPGSTYTYKVMAELNGQYSAFTAPVTLTHPANTTPVPTVITSSSGLSGIDSYLASAAETIKTWYPKIADLIVAGAYAVPNTINLTIDTRSTCPGGWTQATTIYLCEQTARSTTFDSSILAYTSTHILQQYPVALSELTFQGLSSWAGDLATGYIQPMPSKTAYYDDGFGPASYFISWVMRTYNVQNLPRVMNVSAHNVGKQGSLTIEQLAGRSIGSLWSEMTGRHVTNIELLSGNAGYCAQTNAGRYATGTQIVTQVCNQVPAQQLLFQGGDTEAEGGLIRFPAANLCMVADSATAGSAIRLGACDFNNARARWVPTADNGLQSAGTLLCLRPLGGGVGPSLYLELANCARTSVSPNQLWYLPPD